MSKTIVTHDIDLQTVITGAELRDFYQNHWPKAWFVDEFYTDFENDRGQFTLPDDARVKLDDLGWAGWQGPGDAPNGLTRRPIGDLYIEAMAGRTEEAVVSFRLPTAQLDALRAAAADLGATEI